MNFKEKIFFAGFTIIIASVVDLHGFNANTDLDLGSQTNANLDPDPGQMLKPQKV